jgi:hypothetical protein
MRGLLNRAPLAAIILSLLMGAFGITMGAAIGISWTKSQVVPVVLVKPGIGGFEPVDGISIGNAWPKSEVKAVLLVKPGIGGFVPREGISIGNTWGGQDILPVMLVEPSVGGFIPLHLLATGGESDDDLSPRMPIQANPNIQQHDAPSFPSIIEGQIEGDFEGWEGETIVKLTNGQIWQQSEYYYYYRYAFMPKVLIFKSGSAYKMKVEGIERPVGVMRLK